MISVSPDDHRLAAFWATECGARGPALPHIHGDCVDPEYKRHHRCACIECGLTPEQFFMLVHPNVVRLVPPEADIAMREAGIPGDDQPLALPQPGELGVPIMEPGLAKRAYGEAPLQWQAPDGRGKLNDAWCVWAVMELSPIDAEYR